MGGAILMVVLIIAYLATLFFAVTIIRIAYLNRICKDFEGAVMLAVLCPPLLITYWLALVAAQVVYEKS